MDTETKRLISLFIDNYNTLKKPLFWKTNKLNIRLCVLYYALNNVWIQHERLFERIEYIKKHTRWYSPLRSSRITAAAFLDAADDNFQEVFGRYCKCYRALKKAGFNGTKILPFAAMILFAMSPEGNELAKGIKAYTLYRKIKKLHPFLTPLEMLTASVIMATSGRSIGDAFKESENTLYRLTEYGFHPSSGFHLLSGILTYDIRTPDIKADLCTDISTTLLKMNFKMPSLFYGTEGFLALMGDNWNEAVRDMLDTVGLFKLSKSFSSFEREYSLLFASALVVNGFLSSFDTKSTRFLRIGSDIAIRAAIGAQITAFALTSPEAGAGTTSDQKSVTLYKSLKQENTSGTMVLKQ